MSLTDESCLDCPSFLPADKASEFFGDPELDFPMCARFGYLFGTGREPDEKAVVVRKNGTAEVPACSFFGQPAPGTPTPSWSPQLFVPDFDALGIRDDKKQTKPASCLSCSKCAEEDHDDGRLVFVRRSCKATGNLVTCGTAITVASDCAFGVEGVPVKLEPREDYIAHFSNSVVDFEALSRKMRLKMEAAEGPPLIKGGTDFDSDAPVLDEHLGVIRAWRKVLSPRGREHFLPVFETNYFSEAMQAEIPKAGDDADPSLYDDHSGLLSEFAAQSFALDLNLTLVGEPGSGKTEGARWLAWMLNMPFTRLQYNEHSDKEEFLGQMEAKEGTTYVSVGRLPEAWVTPGVLCSDEWNLAPEAIAQIYREMNDASREIVVYKRRFIRHLYCFHLACINPAWDYRNIGAKTMASADTRRLAFHWMPNPDEAMQRRIISNSVLATDGEKLDKRVLDTIIKISADCREAAKQGKIPDPWTLAQDIKVARLVADFGIMGALRRAYFHAIDPEVAEPILTAVKTRIPSSVDWS